MPDFRYCCTANICVLQKINSFFSLLSLEAGRGKHFRKFQAEFPLMFATRTGKCVTHRGLAGICTAPGASLEADGTSLQQPVGPEQATQPLRVPVLAVNGKDISGMSRMQIRYNNNPEHNMLELTPNVFRLELQIGRVGDCCFIRRFSWA